MMTKLAVVLFNLGGPDRPEAIAPFLFNLFNDPAVISVPQPLRWLLAKTISRRRVPVAKEIYAKIGDKSPLLELTQVQARELEQRLTGEEEARVFVAMRYWHPMSDETATEVSAFAPDEIVLLPLYPQYSTATTASSLKDWYRAAAKAGIAAPTRAICCYPAESGLIKGYAKLIRAHLDGNPPEGPARILFSAHGLPVKTIRRGDPYQWQVERTAQGIAHELGLKGRPAEGPTTNDLDWTVCYQSRVGPLEWIGPSLDDELKRAAGDRVAVVVVPIAFVSEHSETLVELDMEYRHMAETLGVPAYGRVPALGATGEFIDGLALLVRRARQSNAGLCSGDGGRQCPPEFTCCPLDR